VERHQHISCLRHLVIAAHGQAPGPRQKQGNYMATGEELKTLEGKSPAERTTYGHERTRQQREQRP
jgi:hypothetical protein